VGVPVSGRASSIRHRLKSALFVASYVSLLENRREPRRMEHFLNVTVNCTIPLAFREALGRAKAISLNGKEG
jgi:hypothetical protein